MFCIFVRFASLRGRQKNPSLVITVWHHSASLVMPDSDPQDGFFYLPLTSMIYPYILRTDWPYIIYKFLTSENAICFPDAFLVSFSKQPLRYILPLQTAQIQISCLLQKPTDLDLHCFPLSMWIFINNLNQIIWLAENFEVGVASSFIQHDKS